VDREGRCQEKGGKGREVKKEKGKRKVGSNKPVEKRPKSPTSSRARKSEKGGERGRGISKKKKKKETKTMGHRARTAAAGS